jgi:RecJ-like exonuclease
LSINEKKIKSFINSTLNAAETILEIVKENGSINVFSHLDTDGITAAGILGKTLFRLDAKFRIKIIQLINEKLVDEIFKEKPQLIIFSDIGGNLDLLEKKLSNFPILVLDHHQISCKKNNFMHVNPHYHNIDGSRDLSGSGVSYFVSKAIDNDNVDLSPLAVVGALGDLQDKYKHRKLGGLNKIIVEDARKANLLTIKKDLFFFGRETRPIYKALASTTNPFIPGISGEEDKSLAFLLQIGIKPKRDENWLTLRDLQENEKKKLCSALAEYLASKGLHYKISDLVCYTYILSTEESWTPLRDAREFSVLLNATGRMDRPSLGVAVCMGERGFAFEEAKKVLEKYRKKIHTSLGWIMEKPERFVEMENIYVVLGETTIDDKIIGSIASILLLRLPKPEKPLIAYSKMRNENTAKFSSRTLDIVIKKGVNLGETMHFAAEKCSGKGGGHNIAAGGQIPIENIDVFIRLVNELIGKQIKGEKIGN